jgi:hypothetical protein
VAEMSSHTIRKITPARGSDDFGWQGWRVRPRRWNWRECEFLFPSRSCNRQSGQRLCGGLWQQHHPQDYPNWRGDDNRLARQAKAVNTTAWARRRGSQNPWLLPLTVQAMCLCSKQTTSARSLQRCSDDHCRPVFGPWHFQDQFCEWDVPPDNSGATRSGQEDAL